MPIALKLRVLMVRSLFENADLKAHANYLIRKLCIANHEVSAVQSEITLSEALVRGEFDLVIVFADLENAMERRRCRQITTWLGTTSPGTKVLVISKFFSGVGEAKDAVHAHKLLLDLAPFEDICGAITQLFQ